MIIQLILFFFLLVFLFFLSQKIQTSIFNNVFIVTQNRNIAIGVLIVLLLPGTIIHELSHFIIATILRVPTGTLTVLPTVEENGVVKAGKLHLGNTDPIRLSLIGLAPILVGLILIYFAGKFLIPNFFQPTTNNQQLITILGIYLLFVISLTMFSSKKDLESLIITGPLILIIVLALYFTGVRVYFEKSLIGKIIPLFSQINNYLLITVVVDSAILLILTVKLHIAQKILKRKIG